MIIALSGTKQDSVKLIDVVPTLAYLLGILRLSTVRGRVLEEIMQ
jgi:hypothetical protein